MSSDSVHPLEGLTQRIRAAEAASTRLVTLRDRLILERDAKAAEIQHLTSKSAMLSMVGELFRALLDQLVVKQVRTIESVVTTGINTIFHDLGLAFEAQVGSRYNKVSVDFAFRQGPPEDPVSVRGSPLDSFGGGPSAVADFILRMMSILRLKRKPLMLLDESLAWVSDEYVDATGQFLAQLAESMQVDVLLVTHKQTFLEHADISYRCAEVVDSDDFRHLELRKL